MAEHTIPSSIEAVTAEWLAEVTGFGIETARTERIGEGIGVSSAIYRAHLHGPNCPQTVVVKLPSVDEAAVFTSTMLRMYIREVRFFDELAPLAPVRVPVRYHAEVHEGTSEFVVVMEDLGSLRLVDQLAGMALTDAERAVDELAGWHATWWGQGDELAERGLTVSLGDPIYPAVLPLVFGEGWEKVTRELEVTESILAVGPRFADAIPRLLAQLSRGPNTMVHGDFRADNILFDARGSVALLDFQLIGSGSGTYDLAYFVTQSLEPDVAAASERALFDRWVAGLVARGVPEADLEGAWDDYRTAALFCLVYPIVASRGMDLSDPRQHELIACMNTRFARAVDQLALADLL
ncbi:MAG TPA: phosphotransferase [Acidimicrobiales bacterium]|nr:phosphotransferase [Acidimicrobiales bacterium]